MTTQSSFRAALLDATQPVPTGLVDGQGRAAGRRYAVYRNNVAVSLTEALATGFPVIAKLIGQENFQGLAGIFLRQSPPESPLMMHYGSQFPAFLDGFEPLKHIGYLGDVARLELALRRSYHAADARAMDPAVLQTMAPDALMQVRFDLAPTVQLVRSPWPIVDIWRFNTQDNAPKPQAVAQDALILRPEFDPLPHVMPAGGAEFLTALTNGDPLGQAHDAATTAHPDFDLASLLGLLLGGAALIHKTPEDIQ